MVVQFLPTTQERLNMDEGEIAAGLTAGVFGAFREWYSVHKQKRRLRQMLKSPTFKWRSVKEMSAAIGRGDDETRKLLVEIEARPQAGNPDLWGLEKRVGKN